jgi:hypothetical protein
MNTIPRNLIRASQTVLEAVKIAPPFNGADIPKNIAATLTQILNSVVDKKKKIKNARFFNSGYIGVVFNVDRDEYFLMMQNTRMGRDDIVRGDLVLQKRGESKPMLKIIAPDSLNSQFPSMGDLGKMVRAVSDLL